MYKLAYDLVTNDDFEILHINESGQEIWLEKYKNKTSQVIRLLNEGFHWKNHLKKDIALAFQKAKAMKRFFLGKHIVIHNVYVSSHSPVDDWETLRKPLKLDEKKPMNMKVYYLSDEEKDDEKARLLHAIESTNINNAAENTSLDLEEETNYYKKCLNDSLYHHKKEIKNVFSQGKPFFTYLLLVVNIFMFILLEFNGGSKSIGTLIEFGAKYNFAIIEYGEWWRIISSMFLHIGFVHLLMNMLAVYYLGIAVERIFGSWRFILIYFLAGIGGGLASFAFSANISAGASGALFGLFGALLFFGLIHKKVFFQTMGKSLLIIIGINIAFGFFVPQVDISAHLGGLIAGFVASAMFHLPQKKKRSVQYSGLIVYVALILMLVIFGIQHNLNSTSYQLMQIKTLVDEGKYEEVVDLATEGLKGSGDLRDELLFKRSYAYIKMNKLKPALHDLKKAIQLNDEFAEAHFNLAILYYNKGDSNKAKTHIKKAYKLKPDKKGFEKLYEQITGKTVE